MVTESRGQEGKGGDHAVMDEGNRKEEGEEAIGRRGHRQRVTDRQATKRQTYGQTESHCVETDREQESERNWEGKRVREIGREGEGNGGKKRKRA